MSTLHSEVVKHVMDAVSRRFATSVILWKQVSGTFQTFDGQRVVDCGVEGIADLGGIIRGGRSLQIEVKVGHDEIRPMQAAFRAVCLDLDVLHCVIRVKDEDDVDDQTCKLLRWIGEFAPTRTAAVSADGSPDRSESPQCYEYVPFRRPKPSRSRTRSARAAAGDR